MKNTLILLMAALGCAGLAGCVSPFGVAPPTGPVVIANTNYFVMGDTSDGTSKPHQVTVDSFTMEVNLVSLQLWNGVETWATNHGYAFDHDGKGKAPSHPVQTVNWYDAVKWCNARSEMEGFEPCYYTADGNLYRTGNTNLSSAWVQWTNNGYRLPTEAEWEKAGKGGLSQRFPSGDKIAQSKANYLANTLSYHWDTGPDGYNKAYATGVLPYTSPVGAFPANGYGLRDMAGNVREWCWDWYHASYYQVSPPNNPHGPANSSVAPPQRVLRGGGWNLLAPVARTANRDRLTPGSAGSNVGFRCVRNWAP
jgi:formylglycine-generating enzyme required for sulfatase activity